MGGFLAGLVLDGVMLAIPAAGGMSMIAFVADAVHASNPLIGWLVDPVYGAGLGVLFGWLLRGQTLDDMHSMLWGGLYGVGWWLIVGLVLLPVLFAFWPFSAGALGRMRNVALPLLLGHVVCGVILGLAFSQITKWTSLRQSRNATDLQARRAA